MILKKQLALTVLSLLLLNPLSPLAHGVDDAKENESLEASHSSKTYSESQLSDIQKKYSLSDEQMKSLKDAGFKPNDMTRVAELSKSSSKSINEIIAMRTEQKMGWGKIAKELGVHPGEMGRAVSSMNHERRNENAHDKAERAEKILERQSRGHHEEKAGGKHH